MSRTRGRSWPEEQAWREGLDLGRQFPIGGDGSCKGGTLVPYDGEKMEILGISGWKLVPELDGFHGHAHWIECVNGWGYVTTLRLDAKEE